MSRLPPARGDRVDRDRPLEFSFDGKPVKGFEGDTIGSALHASGRRVLSRSFKYHRPRGLMCCAGQCPNCLVEVDGWPGVRACTEPVKAGMKVEHMNARPSLEFDLMRSTDLFGSRLTPPGFYYKTFIRPRRLWPLYEKVLRHAAGLGKLARRQADREWRTEYRRRHADVLVLGGGAAGMAAALRAVELGADVVLVDDGPELGGALLVGGAAETARELAARVRAAGVEVLAPAAALGFFDGIVPVWCENTLHQIRADHHVAATGSIEQPLMFERNDIPGVMLSSGAQRLASLYGVRPGKAALVATVADRGLEAALALHEAQIEVVGVVDSRSSGADPQLVARLQRAGIPLRRGSAVVRAVGRRQVKGAVVAELDDAGRPMADGEHGINCDLIAVSGGTVPATSLLLQAGAKARWSEVAGAYLPEALPASIHAAGAVAGHASGAAAELSGAAAGAEAALALGLGDEADHERLRLEREALSGEAEPASQLVPAAAGSAHGRHEKCFACLCEDVTTDDIKYAIDEGFDSLELLKRYTTVTMGPCQGRMCQLPSIRQMSADTGASVADVGLTTARPPWSTVPMGVLAGRPFEPAKRSAVHGQHRQLQGNVMWAGDWRRPYDYGDPEGETMAVHESAGLIDVSTLGKLIVRGPQAGEFLNHLYPNRFDNLKRGRIRYGVLGDDAGRITDDGTICRLDEQSFYVTTTSSGADAVESWFGWWLAEWEMETHLTDVSQGVSAFNLAGPRSREILSSLTDLDCSNESFAYLDGKRAHVAGVPCLLLRIGFVGELGYELHCPGALAPDLWDALIEAGEPHGIRPFGLEPQRVLRLQKLHILVGQDTDAESNPLEAAMPWIVKFDKDEDFIGRWALESVNERGPENKLVGFTMDGTGVPSEGAAVVADGQPVGRVTSARFSPRLEQTIGMAWVPAALGEDGATITLADRGKRSSARVQTAPFYDPDQELLRGMSFEFLAPDAVLPANGETPVLRSPIEWVHRRDGAQFADRAGWRLVADYGSTSKEAAACRASVGVADVCFYGKLELQGDPGAVASIVAELAGGAALEPRRAAIHDGVWWCPISPGRVLALTPPEATSALRRQLEAAAAGGPFASVHELTTSFGSNAVVGPLARETFARATALDMRPDRFPEAAFAPVSVARTPGMVLRQRGDRYLHLFGAGYAQYTWTVFIDAAQSLGGRAVGAEALSASRDGEAADA